jgi:hypothetical protein
MRRLIARALWRILASEPPPVPVKTLTVAQQAELEDLHDQIMSLRGEVISKAGGTPEGAACFEIDAEGVSRQINVLGDLPHAR